MFQYAFGVAAANALGARFRFEAEELSPYFKLGYHVDPRSDIFARVASRFVRYQRREVVADDRENPRNVLATLTNRTHYGGHYYSDEFFLPAADRVRDSFSVHPQIAERFLSKYESLVDGGYVCAHVRLTDFATYRDDVRLPPGFYRRALAVLDQDIPIVFVSDDIASVEASLAGDSRMRFERNDEITDFLLLRNATQVISSNSSFSWWAAWLNDRPGLRVIAPRWWLGINEGREVPVRAIPTEWEQIPARCKGDGTWRSSR